MVELKWPLLALSERLDTHMQLFGKPVRTIERYAVWFQMKSF